MKRMAPKYKDGFSQAVEFLSLQADALRQEGSAASVRLACQLLLKRLELERCVYMGSKDDSALLWQLADLYERDKRFEEAAKLLMQMLERYERENRPAAERTRLLQSLHRLYARSGAADRAREARTRCEQLVFEELGEQARGLVETLVQLRLTAGRPGANPEDVGPKPCVRAESTVERGQVYFLRSKTQGEPHPHPWVILSVSKRGYSAVVSAVNLSHTKPEGPTIELPAGLVGGTMDSHATYVWISAVNTFALEQISGSAIGVVPEPYLDQIVDEVHRYLSGTGGAELSVSKSPIPTFGEVFAVGGPCDNLVVVLSGRQKNRSSKQVQVAPVVTDFRPESHLVPITLEGFGQMYVCLGETRDLPLAQFAGMELVGLLPELSRSTLQRHWDKRDVSALDQA